MDSIDRAINRKRQAEIEQEAEKEKIILALKAELKPLADLTPGWIKEIEAYAPKALAELDRLEKTEFATRYLHFASQINELRAMAMNNPNMLREGLKIYNRLSTKDLPKGIRFADRAAGLRNDIKAQLQVGRGCRYALERGVKYLRSVIEHDEQKREYERSIGMPTF